jgi:hypothetical protein
MYLTNKEVHGIMLSKAVDSVLKTINICKNYTNKDTQVANFLNCKKRRSDRPTDPIFNVSTTTTKFKECQFNKSVRGITRSKYPIIVCEDARPAFTIL